jgi:diguanylate cyclase (GGDEF)-like protein
MSEERPIPLASDTMVVATDRHRRAPTGSERTSLVTIHGPGLGSKIDLDEAMTIGRGANSDVVVNLADVSRRHCRISRSGDAFVVSDLGSTNGTFLNEQRVEKGVERTLQPGDILNLGGVIYKVLDGKDIEAQYHEELYRTAIIDGLTQIYNRRYLTEFLEREMARAERYSREVTLLLLDVDHFKHINDEFGHLVGDQVLRELAVAVSEGVRQECCFARYGGEEFALVLPETSLPMARMVAERLRQLIENHEFGSGGARMSVTVSVGVAVLEDEMSGAAELFHAADEKLYEAKHRGRNQVVG